MRPNMDGAFASGDPPATEVGITFSDVGSDHCGAQRGVALAARKEARADEQARNTWR